MIIFSVLIALAAASKVCHEMQNASTTGINVLMEMYNHTYGLWADNSTDFLNWWNSANMINTIADYVDLVPSQLQYHEQTFENTFSKAQEYALIQKQDWKGLQLLEQHYKQKPVLAGFTRMYYDDDGWWALAWIKVYDVTGQPRYLKAAEMIFEHIRAAWSPVCGGGVWWNSDKDYKNAIANELFMHVAASLANRVDATARPYYLSWAKKEYDWFVNSGMINSDYLINDGLDLGSCENNNQTTWSYNQGVILGALVELDRLQPGTGKLDLAHSIAQAAIRHLSDTKGILHDECEPNCWQDGDSPQFKGIFVRNLAKLDRVSPSWRYKQYIVDNALSVWNNRNRHDEFGDVWTGPSTAITAQSHASGLDAIISSIRECTNV